MNSKKYANGKIYKLMNDVNSDIYVGSTIEAQLSNRMGHHRTAAKLGKTSKIYSAMQDIGVEHFTIILVELYPCQSKDELRSREHYWITELNPTLNTYGAIATMDNAAFKRKYYEEKPGTILKRNQEWREKTNYNQIRYEANKVELLQKTKKYYEANKDTLRQKGRDRYDSEKAKQYRKANEDKLMQNRQVTIYCDACKHDINKDQKARHYKSKKHIENLKACPEILDPNIE